MLVTINVLLVALNIIFTILVARADSEANGIKTAGKIIGILSIIYSLIQQVVTFLFGGLLLSISDGNKMNPAASLTYILLLFIPVAIIIAAIVLLVKVSKKN